MGTRVAPSMVRVVPGHASAVDGISVTDHRVSYDLGRLLFDNVIKYYIIFLSKILIQINEYGTRQKSSRVIQLLGI